MSQALHHALVWVPVAVVVALAMDAWAALIHRVVWHGPLWRVHRSHHVPRAGRFEDNDALSVLHAPIATAFVLYGCAGPAGTVREVVYGLGIGMTAFGVAYVIVHDGLVHERLPVRFLLRAPLLRDVVEAHRQHHLGSHGGLPYGLFFGPRELRRSRALTPSASNAPATPSPGGRSPRPARPPSVRPPRGPAPG